MLQFRWCVDCFQMLPQEAVTLRASSALPSSARVQRRAQQQATLKTRLGRKESMREKHVNPGLKESKLLGEKRGLVGHRKPLHQYPSELGHKYKYCLIKTGIK